MTLLVCRTLAKDCLDTLSAEDATEIQKVYLDHVHAKHPLEWRQLSKQLKVISIMTIRDRFRKKMAETPQEAPAAPAARSLLPVAP